MTADIKRPPKPDPDTPRILRVRVPVRQHLALHKHRLLAGESLSALVTAALEEYLEGKRRERGA